jgi:hypothetical protein
VKVLFEVRCGGVEARGDDAELKHLHGHLFG